MTFDAEETSVESGQPTELYEFVIGSVIYRYTSAEDQITFNSVQWFPRQISRNSPVQSTDERKSQLKITLPTEDDVASRFIGIVPGELMTLTITRVHRGDPSNGYIIWKGRITGAAYVKDGAECQLACLTTEAAFSRPIPRHKYQGLCNHVLYDGGCKIVRASNFHSGLVTGVVGSEVTVAGLLAAESAQWSRGGYIEFGTNEDFRLVLDQPADTCTLLLPFSSDIVGQTVKVYAGCDHTLAVCLSKFNNVDNYGGFPYVPTKNPFTTRL